MEKIDTSKSNLGILLDFLESRNPENCPIAPNLERKQRIQLEYINRRYVHC